MNTLGIKLIAALEMLKNKEKRIKNEIDYLKESKSKLLYFHRQYHGKSEYELTDLHIESLEEIRKELNNNKQMT